MGWRDQHGSWWSLGLSIQEISKSWWVTFSISMKYLSLNESQYGYLQSRHWYSDFFSFGLIIETQTFSLLPSVSSLRHIFSVSVLSLRFRHFQSWSWSSNMVLLIPGWVGWVPSDNCVQPRPKLHWVGYFWLLSLGWVLTNTVEWNTVRIWNAQHLPSLFLNFMFFSDASNYSILFSNAGRQAPPQHYCDCLVTMLARTLNFFYCDCLVTMLARTLNFFYFS